MNCTHLDPKKWTEGQPNREGKIPTYCPGCRKFMGYIVPYSKHGGRK